MKKILFLVLLISTLSLSAASPCGIWDKTINAVTNAGNNIDCAVHTLNAKGACPGCTLIGITKDAIKLAPGIKITDLSGAQLRYVNFANFDFGNAKLDGANLVGANLEGATFSGSLLGTNLSSAHLKGARLEHATLGNDVKGASLYGADLTGAFFTNNQTINHVGFAGAKISGTDFSGAKIQNLVGELKDDISHETFGTKYTTGLAGPGVTYLDFRGAKNLDKAIFTHAHMPMLNLSNMTGPNSLNLPNFTGANLTGADFSGSNLVGCVFPGANLKGADFTGSTLYGCNLDNANLTGAVFDGATFTYGTVLSTGLGQHTSFKKAVFKVTSGHTVSAYMGGGVGGNYSYADFSGATIDAVDALNSVFDHALFKYATVSGPYYAHASYKNCDFTGAKLLGSFETSNFDHANMHNTIITGNISHSYLTNVTFSSTYIYTQGLNNIDFTGSTWAEAYISPTANYTGTVAPGFTNDYPYQAACYKNRYAILSMCGSGVPGTCTAYCDLVNDHYYNHSADTCFNSGSSSCHMKSGRGYHFTGSTLDSSVMTECCPYFNSKGSSDYHYLLQHAKPSYDPNNPTAAAGLFKVIMCTKADQLNERQNCKGFISGAGREINKIGVGIGKGATKAYDKTKQGAKIVGHAVMHPGDTLDKAKNALGKFFGGL